MVHTLADVTIASTGVSQALQTTSKNVSWVRIQSPTGNTTGRVGDSNTTSTRGYILLAATELFLPPCGNTANYDLSQIFINGTATQSFPVTYGIV